MVSCLPCASRLSRLPFIVPSVTAACFWLVVVCKIFNRRPSTPRAQPISLFFLSLTSIRNLKQWDNDPHTFRPGRASSLTPPSPLTMTFGWLLCVKCSIGGRLCPGPSPSLYFFRCSPPLYAPANNGTTTPTRSAPVASPL